MIRRLLSALRNPGEALQQKVVHSGLWAVFGKISTAAVDFLRTVVLARLLAPEDFGLFGIALLAQITLNNLLGFGVDEALIQREEGAEGLLDVAWTVKLFKALLVAGTLLLTAPYIAAFFDAPRAEPVIRVLSAVVLLQGLQNIGVIYFRKELELGKDFALNFTTALLNAVVAIAGALILGSVWALMAGIVAGAAGYALLSYAVHPYRPSLAFDWRKLRELWTYGKWLFGSGTLMFAATRGDDILLGRWLGAPALGVYQVSYRISNSVATEITHVISRVTFPAYAKLQTRHDDLREGFLSTLVLTAMLTVPLAGAIALFVPELVQYVIGEQWAAAIVPIQILAAAGLIRALSACWGPLYLATGNTRDTFWKQLLRALLTLGPAYPLTTRYGIAGMSLCVLLGISGSMTYNLWLSSTGRRFGLGAGDLLRAAGPAALASILAAASVYLMRGSMSSSLWTFTGFAALYLAVYGVTVVVLHLSGADTGIARLERLWQSV